MKEAVLHYPSILLEHLELYYSSTQFVGWKSIGVERACQSLSHTRQEYEMHSLGKQSLQLEERLWKSNSWTLETVVHNPICFTIKICVVPRPEIAQWCGFRSDAMESIFESLWTDKNSGLHVPGVPHPIWRAWQISVGTSRIFTDETTLYS